MSTGSRLRIADFDVEVLYKDIRNLHVGVYPPDGRVRVAAPLALDDERVRMAVLKRLAWVRRNRRELQAAVRQSEREMLTGESHYVWGRRMRLRVERRSGRPSVSLDGDRLTLRAPLALDADGRRALLRRWERRQLYARLVVLVPAWAQRMGCEAPPWGIRRMKTKWGSCSHVTGRLWFNLELAKKEPRCLEYVVVHEMAHLFEPGHNDRFVALLDRHLPDWRSRQHVLNHAPLSAEHWAD